MNEKILLVVFITVALLLGLFVGYRMSQNNRKPPKKKHRIPSPQTYNYETNYYSYDNDDDNDDTVSVESEDEDTHVEDETDDTDANLHVKCKRGVIEGQYNSAGRGCCVVSNGKKKKGMCCRRVNRKGKCAKGHWTR
jgi:hypothetical protein